MTAGLSPLSIALPALILAALAGALGVKSGLLGNVTEDNGFIAPQTVMIEPRIMTYRAEGHYLRDGFPVDAPMVTKTLQAPFEIMKYQVTTANYAQCVIDGACMATDIRPQKAGQGTGNVPVTGVNFTDAANYAKWLSEKTGETWQLPTDEQWAFAAGSKFPDDALGIEGDDGSNPALRWLKDYERESARKQARNPALRPSEAFGENELGVADMAGNVWEWTRTCHRRVNVDEAGNVQSDIPACGIYVVDGKHRASMSFFIRDPKTGGCSVGVPPDNLGFRLVRDGRWYVPLLQRVASIFG
ncbi:MAG: SUMF1/EgtB/PvdO family nonheme iron enzyme [Phyllobacterium sp.]